MNSEERVYIPKLRNDLWRKNLILRSPELISEGKLVIWSSEMLSRGRKFQSSAQKWFLMSKNLFSVRFTTDNVSNSFPSSCNQLWSPRHMIKIIIRLTQNHQELEVCNAFMFYCSLFFLSLLFIIIKSNRLKLLAWKINVFWRNEK